MSNCDFCNSDFNTLGANSGPGCDPVSDLTLSTMVVGNQEALFCKLIMILLFLYAYTNQSFISYLICTNDKIINHELCLTDKMVDSLMDQLEDCNSELERCRRHHHSH